MLRKSRASAKKRKTVTVSRGQREIGSESGSEIREEWATPAQRRKRSFQSRKKVPGEKIRNPSKNSAGGSRGGTSPGKKPTSRVRDERHKLGMGSEEVGERGESSKDGGKMYQKVCSKTPRRGKLRGGIPVGGVTQNNR